MAIRDLPDGIKRADMLTAPASKLHVVGFDDDDTTAALYDPRVRDLRAPEVVAACMRVLTGDGGDAAQFDAQTVALARLALAMRHVMLTGVTARKNGERFDVVAGRRRVVGARALGLFRGEEALVPFAALNPRTATDATATAAMLSENEHRSPSKIVDTAQKLATWAQALPRDADVLTQAAELIGVSRSSARNLLALASLPVQGLELVRAGAVKLAQAYKVARRDESASEKLARLRSVAESNASPKPPKAPGLKSLAAQLAAIVAGVADTLTAQQRKVLERAGALGLLEAKPKRKARKPELAPDAAMEREVAELGLL